MSADYSFYALLCGYMPPPEGVLKKTIERLSSFLYVLLRVIPISLFPAACRRETYTTKKRKVFNLASACGVEDGDVVHSLKSLLQVFTDHFNHYFLPYGHI